MQVASHAKINWFLRVIRKRDDGYHDLETLFQTISLHDTLTFAESDRFTLTCDDPSIPTGDTNLILRAARALGTPPVAIELRKRIPAGGGLGGGSSNAAATLTALATMFGIDTPLHEIALSLGSDVPFFLVGGTAYATGRGEELTPVASASAIPLLLVFPEERVATPRAFGLLRHFSKPLGIERVRAMLDDGLLSHAAELTNDFEEPIFDELPHLADIKTQLLDLGATWAAMSGSGSTIAAAFASGDQRDAAMARVGGVPAETL